MAPPELSPPVDHKPPRRWPRRLARVALTLAVLFIVLFVGVGPWWIVNRLTRGRYVYPDPDLGLTPSALQLGFEEAAFTSSDGVPLKGWWVAAPQAKGTVVLVHGLNRSRVEMLRKLPFLHGRGWNALLFDLRRHGESGGELRTLGWHERLDVKAALAEARRRSPAPLVVWGVSLGAASAMFAAADDPEVAGVVSDSSYRSLEDTLRHHVAYVRQLRFWLKPLPSGLLAAEALFWLGRTGGFDTGEADVVRAAARLAGRPALFVANAGDWRMPTDIAFDLKAAAGKGARVLVVPGRKHGHAYRDGTAAYESAVGELLEDVLLSSRRGETQGRISGRVE